MVKKAVSIIFTASLLMLGGWFTDTELWEHVYISGFNSDINSVEPSGSDDAPDGMTVALPVTVYVKIEPSEVYDTSVNKAELQYKYKDSGSWTSWNTLNSIEKENLEKKNIQHGLGRKPLTSAEVPEDTDVMLRLYIANTDTGRENASLSSDTTEEGTNGWQDQWVTLIHTASGTRPEWEEDPFD